MKPKTLAQFVRNKQIWLELNDNAQLANIWGHYGGNAPFPFVNYSDFNLLFCIEYGTLPLSAGIDKLTAKEVAASLAHLFGVKWASQASAYHNLAKNLERGKTTTICDNGSNTVTNTASGQRVDQLAAFNETNLVADKGETNESESEQAAINENTKTITESNPNSMLNRLHYSDDLDILKTVFKDTANFLKIAIY